MAVIARTDAHFMADLPVIKADIVIGFEGALLGEDHFMRLKTGLLVGVGLAVQCTDDGDACGEGGTKVDSQGLFALGAAVVKIELGTITHRFSVIAKADIEIRILPVADVWNNNSQKIGVALAKKLCALIGRISQSDSSFMNPLNLFTGHVAAAVEYV